MQALALPLGFLKRQLVKSLRMVLNSFKAQKINDLLKDMSDEAEAIIQNNLDEMSFVEERFAFMRYAGQGHEIKVPIDNSVLENQHAVKIKASFEEQYEKLYSNKKLISSISK